jgi:hypothetical protein
MIIYCAGPIRGDVTYQKFYTEIINHVEEEGHTALAEFNTRFSVSVQLTDKQIYKRDIKWIDSCRFMIAEISGPSIGVGFEIAYAIFVKHIPVLALCHSQVKKLSAMLSGCDSPLVSIERYANAEEMKQIINEYINRLTDS